MNFLECTPVTGFRQRRQFLKLEREIYRDVPQWIPPLWDERKRLVGFKHHPFYDNAQCQAFLATRNGKPVGRIVAIINHGHNELHNEKRGFFGFFESVDDVAVAERLFETAIGWLSEQGMTDCRGPVNPSLNYECGLLVEGFDTPATFLIPYNRDYYGALIEACGFEKCQDLYSYDAPFSKLRDLDPKLMFVVEEATKRFKVKCRPIDRSRFHQDVRSFLEIYNLSLQQTWGYVPMSESEIDHQSASLKWLIVPKLTSIAEIDGKPVGAGFGMLDFNPIIKKIDGRLLPLGWLTLLRKKKKMDRLRFISTNVLPEYQKWGLGLVTLARILPDAIDFGIRMGEFSWVLESNSLSRKTIERGGGIRSKVHRIYDRPFPSG